MNGKSPKWPINSKKHTELARQAAMVLLFQQGVQWTGSPTNEWLAEQMGVENLYLWWRENGRSLCAMSNDAHIFDQALWENRQESSL